MKKWYVYEIVNLMGTVEYVGETTTPKRRWNDHHKPSGRFGNRSDVFMSIVCEFNNRKDAYQYQCELQKEYGLKTDIEKSKGRIPWNKGKTGVYSKETLENISKGMKNKIVTNETKKRLSDSAKLDWIKRKKIVK